MLQNLIDWLIDWWIDWFIDWLIIFSAIFEILLNRDLSRLRRLTLCFRSVDVSNVGVDNADVDIDATFSSFLRRAVESSERIEHLEIFVLVTLPSFMKNFSFPYFKPFQD